MKSTYVDGWELCGTFSSSFFFFLITYAVLFYIIEVLQLIKKEKKKSVTNFRWFDSWDLSNYRPWVIYLVTFYFFFFLENNLATFYSSTLLLQDRFLNINNPKKQKNYSTDVIFSGLFSFTLFPYLNHSVFYIELIKSTIIYGFLLKKITLFF